MDKSVRSTLRRQAGIISYRQALGLGMTARQIHHRTASGEWVRVHPGVYRHGVVTPTPEAAMRAAALWIGPGAMLTAHAAAWWWDMCVEPPVRWEFVGGSTHLQAPVAVQVSRAFVDPGDCTTHRGISVISRPLAGLRGAVALERLRPGRGITMIDRAKQGKLITDADLDAAFRRNRGTWGTVAMRAILEQVCGSAHSELERRAVRLLRAAGIDGFVINFKTRLSNGRPVEFDIAFPKLKLVIELDGFAHHSSAEQLRDDHRRQREVMDDGWTVRRFTWADVVADPDGFVRAVLALIA